MTISVDGDLPLGSGLGSSAAMAHALFKALAALNTITISETEMIKLVQQSEKYAHGNPSGLDATAVVVGGTLVFQKMIQKKSAKLTYQKIPSLAFHSYGCFLIQSGKPAESTRDMVEQVAKAVKKNAANTVKKPPSAKQILEKINHCSRQIIDGLLDDMLETDALVENQMWLEKLGVVGRRAKQIIAQLAAIGAVAKITGGGGIKDGSGMILAFHSNPKKMITFLQKQSWPWYQVHLGT